MSSRTPCAACKTLRRKCTADCAFAPYFPPEQPYKFEVVHKVYGASTVARILSEIAPAERVEAVSSLVYEAEARVKDPIYGCVGSVSILQHKLKQVQTRLDSAKQELASYIGPSAMVQVLNRRFMPQFQNQQALVVPVIASNLEQMLGSQRAGTSQGAQHEQELVEGAKEQNMLRNLEQQKQHYQQQEVQQQQSVDLSRFTRRFDGNQQLYEGQKQQLVGAAREQDMLRNLEHQHQLLQHKHQKQSMDVSRFNSRFDGAGPSSQATDNRPGAMAPSLGFGGSNDSNVCQIQKQPQQERHQLIFQQQNQPWRRQPQPHPQQEQHHPHLQQLIPHQLLLQQQNQPLQPQPQPQQEQHDHLQPPQQQNQPLLPQPQPNHGG